MPYYRSPKAFTRTDQERADPFLSWARDDVSFFAAGACHILAFLFSQVHRYEGFRPVLVRPAGGRPGLHVFASDDEWAFDFNGWTRQSELLAALEADYRADDPTWSYRLIPLSGQTHQSCSEYNLRAPCEFPYLPWERAYRYLSGFPAAPPS